MRIILPHTGSGAVPRGMVQTAVRTETAVHSSRIPANRATNRLAHQIGRLRAAAIDINDLTESNPTRVDIEYPADLLVPLGSAGGLDYDPQPRGLLSARRAVAAWLDAEVDPDRIVLTASTSEAYSLLFKLLCDPGDDILVPQPSYPLFEHLARFEGVDCSPYPLVHDGRHWRIDTGALEAAARPRTRAIVAVNPNNPTGSYLAQPDRDALAALCRAHDIPLIVDEVFNGYAIDPRPGVDRSVLDSDASGGRVADDVVTFVLGGLSKAVGLPQVKLAWMVVDGPGDAVPDLLDALDLLADTYLSVSTPAQRAAPHLLSAGAAVTSRIRTRVTGNYAWLVDRAVTTPAVRILCAEGGWSAVIRLGAAADFDAEEALAMELLEDAQPGQERVLVHPGYFFDFVEGSHVVISLLPPPGRFRAGVRRLLARAGTHGGR